MDNKISVDEQLGWRMATFAQALDVSRSKAYQVAAEHPEITVRIGGCLRIVPANRDLGGGRRGGEVAAQAKAPPAGDSRTTLICSRRREPP
jgi:hypothetical protein